MSKKNISYLHLYTWKIFLHAKGQGNKPPVEVILLPPNSRESISWQFAAYLILFRFTDSQRMTARSVYGRIMLNGSGIEHNMFPLNCFNKQVSDSVFS